MTKELPGPQTEQPAQDFRALFDLHGQPTAAEPEPKPEPSQRWPFRVPRPGRGTMWFTRQGWYLHGSQAHREAIEAERAGKMAGPFPEEREAGR